MYIKDKLCVFQMNECAYLLLQIILFVLPIFHLSLLVPAYENMQTFQKSFILGRTNFIQRQNLNLKRSCLCLLLQPYAFVFINKHSSTWCVANIRSHSLVFVNY